MQVETWRTQAAARAMRKGGRRWALQPAGLVKARPANKEYDDKPHSLQPSAPALC
jgi:hypothetical protein